MEENSKDEKGVYYKNKNSKKENLRIKSTIYSIKKHNYKLNRNKINNSFQKTNNIYPLINDKKYQNYKDSNNKTQKKENIIQKEKLSKDNNNSNNMNSTITNNEGENALNSEIILKEQKNEVTFLNNKKAKINPFKNKIRYKYKKENIFYKFKKTHFKSKEKNINLIKETRTNENKKNKIKNSKIISYKAKIEYLSLNNEDFQDMNYNQALILDKRAFIRIYWSFLVDTQIILGTFFTSNFLNLFVVKLSFLIWSFQINFFLNALFYTDEYISDAYHNDGVLDFFTGLTKSIYSFLVTLVTTNLLGMLSNSKNELINTIKNRNYKIDYLLRVNLKLKKLRNKLIAYYIFLFVLGTFFTYYVSAFCSVYRNSQKYWFIGCFESFLIDSLSSVGICIFLALFRYISLKKRIKFLYILANLINIFI